MLFTYGAPSLCVICPAVRHYVFFKFWSLLQKIAGEKAGIFKAGRPGFSVPQPDDAMQVIQVP
jgi:hypothetical protein